MPPGTTERSLKLSNVDAFYFSTVCFTTLGFGDLVPGNDAAKILVCIEAIFGVSHMVIFFSTITLVGISARYVESDDGL